MVRWSPSLPCSFRNKLKQTEREGRPTPRSCERAGGRSVGHTALICCAVWLSRMPPKKTSTKKPKAARTVSPPGKAASKAETSNRTKTAAKPLQRKPTSPSKKKKSSGSPPKKPKAASGYPQASARKSSNMSSLLPSPPLGKSMRPSTPVASVSSLVGGTVQHIVSKLGLSGHGTVGGIGGANPSSSCCGVMLAGKSNCNTTQAVSRASKAKEKHRAYMYQPHEPLPQQLPPQQQPLKHDGSGPRRQPKLGAYERIDVTAGLRDEVITNLSSAESSLGLALDWEPFSDLSPLDVSMPDSMVSQLHRIADGRSADVGGAAHLGGASPLDISDQKASHRRARAAPRTLSAQMLEDW